MVACTGVSSNIDRASVSWASLKAISMNQCRNLWYRSSHRGECDSLHSIKDDNLLGLARTNGCKGSIDYVR